MCVAKLVWYVVATSGSKFFTTGIFIQHKSAIDLEFVCFLSILILSSSLNSICQFLNFCLQLKSPNGKISLWKCYFHFCWSNFTLGGVYKLFGDLVGLAGPLGISVIIQYVANGTSRDSSQTEVSITIVLYFKWTLAACCSVCDAQMHRAVVMHIWWERCRSIWHQREFNLCFPFSQLPGGWIFPIQHFVVFKWSHCLHRVRLCSSINNLVDGLLLAPCRTCGNFWRYYSLVQRHCYWRVKCVT